MTVVTVHFARFVGRRRGQFPRTTNVIDGRAGFEVDQAKVSPLQFKHRPHGRANDSIHVVMLPSVLEFGARLGLDEHAVFGIVQGL